MSLGLTAGFFRGGWLEQLLMRSLDAIASIPLLIWAIALVGILGTDDVHVGSLNFGNEVKVLALLGLLYIPTLARITYTTAAAESLANLCRCAPPSGCRQRAHHAIGRAAQLPLAGDRAGDTAAGVGIVIEASISFVGLGVQPPRPSWGNMLAEARNYLFTGEWWLSVFPGMAIAISVIAFNLLGDGLRDVLDPRHDTAGPTA